MKKNLCVDLYSVPEVNQVCYPCLLLVTLGYPCLLLVTLGYLFLVVPLSKVRGCDVVGLRDAVQVDELDLRQNLNAPLE